MTKNEKARELIATSETTVKVDPQNGWYLKRFAALQFEGSVDNFDTNMPIHVLEQQIPKDNSMKLDDAINEGEDIDYSKFYDEDGCSYSSVSEFVEAQLGLDDDDSIREYNEENPDLPYIPYEKLRDMDKKDLPKALSSVADEADYVDAYKEVTDIASYSVEVVPMSSNYETMGFAFTHQGLKEYEKSIDNHIFYPCYYHARTGEQYSREVGDFHPIMEFLHSVGEQLLREDIRRYDIKPAVIRTKEEMHEFYRTQPDEMILAALVEVDDKVSGKRYCSIRVWCSGYEVKTRSTGSYYVLNKHYLTVNKDDMVATYPYPFSCDDGANTLLEAKDTDILTPVERLFLWTEYKNPNSIETKKKQGESIMNTYNVVVSVSTTVCIDAESADDAIEKVSQALNNDDANMSADVASRIGDSMRNGHYEVTNAIPMDE